MKKETKEKLLKILKEIEEIIINDDGGDSKPPSLASGDTADSIEENNEKKELVKIVKEMDDTVVVSTGYFNPYHWSKELVEKDQEKKQMLNELNGDRVKNLKYAFSGAEFDKESKKGFVFTKAENPDWKEKLENFIKSDKEFCEQKTKELELLNSENPDRDEFAEDLKKRTENKNNRAYGL